MTRRLALRLAFEHAVDTAAIWLIDRRRFGFALTLWRLCRLV